MYLLLPALAYVYTQKKQHFVAALLILIGIGVSFYMASSKSVYAYILPHIMPYGTADV